MAVALTNTEGRVSAFPAWLMYFTTFSSEIRNHNYVLVEIVSCGNPGEVN